MRSIAAFARRWAAMSLLGALAAGCSASGTAGLNAGPNSGAQDRALADGRGARSNAAGSRVSGWLSPLVKRKKGKNLIYWGNYGDDSIVVFSSKGVNGKEKGQINQGLSDPERLFVDKKLDVYASNIGNSTVTAYKPGQQSPFLTISDGVNDPTGLTVDAAGTVYCANVGNDTITEYPAGQLSPSLTISLSNTPEYLATDAADNLYASVGAEVMEFPKGSSTGKNLGLNIVAPGALEVDRSGNVIAIDENANTIDVFPAGQRQPSKQVSVTSGSAFALSLGANEKHLYVSVDATGGNFIVQVLAYPGGTELTNKLTTGAGDWPVAVSPDNALGG